MNRSSNLTWAPGDTAVNRSSNPTRSPRRVLNCGFSITCEMVDRYRSVDGPVHCLKPVLNQRAPIPGFCAGEGMYNASRNIKAYGTTARKGDSTEDRPHRMSRILEAPASMSELAVEQLQELAAQAPKRLALAWYLYQPNLDEAPSTLNVSLWSTA